jgi:Tol biopolymer transport system component
MKVEEEPLYELQAGEKAASGNDALANAFAIAGTRVVTACRLATAAKHDFVVVNGKRGPDVDDVRSLQADESRQHVVYTAKVDKTEFAFVDGEPGPGFARIEEPAFSPDGRRFGYFGAAKKGKDWNAIIDGKPGLPFSALRGLAFSADGKHVVYAGNRGGALDKYGSVQGGRWSLVLDDKEVETDKHDVHSASFAPDGRLAYVVSDGEAGPERVIAGGKAQEDVRSARRLVWGATGSLAYVADLGGKELAVVDGERITPGGESVGDLTFGGDGRRYFFTIASKRIVIDGKEVTGHGDVSNPIFSPDGKRVALTAEKGGKKYIIVDGNTGPALENDRGISVEFSANSAHYAYFGAVGGAERVFLDGVPRGGAYGNTFGLRLSPDGSRLACAVLDGGRSVWIVDDKPESMEFQVGFVGSDFAFSPDGRHYAHVGGKKGKVCFVVDGVLAGNPVDRISQFGPLADGSFVAFARRKSAPLLLRAVAS